MGKGDQRSKRGKLYRGTHGKAHPGKKPERKPEPKSPQRPPASSGA